jgi:hypothetical protein
VRMTDKGLADGHNGDRLTLARSKVNEASKDGYILGQEAGLMLWGAVAVVELLATIETPEDFRHGSRQECVIEPQSIFLF